MGNGFLIGLILLLLATPLQAQEGQNEPVMTAQQQQTLVKQMMQAGLSETAAADLGGAMAAAQFTSEQGERISQQLRATVNDRLVRDALVSKVHEGLAKRMGPETIFQALDRVRTRYGVARQMARSIPPGDSAELGGVIADGLSSGLRQEDAGQLTHGLQNRANQQGLQPLAVETMTAARDMVRLGVMSQTAANVLSHALEHDYDAAAMRVLRQTLSAQRAQGNMNQVAEKMAAAIQSGVSAKDLAARVQSGGNRSNTDKGSGSSGSGSGSGGSGGSGSGSGGSGGGSGGSGGKGGSGGSGGSSGGGKGGGNGGGGGKGGGKS